MRMTRLAQVALVCGFMGMPAALGQDADDGAGRLPAARSETKLQGGPGFVCTATNQLHTVQCSISCSSRETADCEDADDAGPPTCRCGTE